MRNRRCARSEEEQAKLVDEVLRLRAGMVVASGAGGTCAGVDATKDGVAVVSRGPWAAVTHVFSHVTHDVRVHVTEVDTAPPPVTPPGSQPVCWMPFESLATAGLTTWACKVLEAAVATTPWLRALCSGKSAPLAFLGDRPGTVSTNGASDAGQGKGSGRKRSGGTGSRAGRGAGAGAGAKRRRRAPKPAAAGCPTLSVMWGASAAKSSAKTGVKAEVGTVAADVIDLTGEAAAGAETGGQRDSAAQGGAAGVLAPAPARVGGTRSGGDVHSAFAAAVRRRAGKA